MFAEVYSLSILLPTPGMDNGAVESLTFLQVLFLQSKVISVFADDIHPLLSSREYQFYYTGYIIHFSLLLVPVNW
jgi:hypothetical protein